MILSALVAVVLTAGEPASAVAPTATQAGAANASAAAPALDPGQNPRDFDNPPPGASAADQALWRRAYEVNNAIPLAYSRGTRLQTTANTSGYNERLDALSARGPADAKRAQELRNTLQAAWSQNADVLLEQWPVDKTRACRYPLQIFDGVLYHDESPRKPAQLADARRMLEECVGYAERTVRYVTGANDDLQRAIAELDLALAGIPIGAPAAASKEPPQAPAPAGAPSRS